MRSSKGKARGAATKAASTTDDIQAGQAVYRVVEYEPPEGHYTWRIEERRIAQVTSLKLRLNRPFPGSSRQGLMLKSVCVGRIFYLSAEAALDAFRETALRTLALHDRAIDAAKRELDWWQGEADARRRREAQETDDALFVILGARDDSDGEASTSDYAVCYLKEELPAQRLAERMNDLAHKLERFMPPTEEGVQAMRALDLRWARGTKKPTHYRVERVPRGVAP